MHLEIIEQRFEWLQHWLSNYVHSKINNAHGGNMRNLTFDEFLHCKGLDKIAVLDGEYIPAMTDPLGQYWAQPHLNQITLRNGYAEMTAHSFNVLKEYSSTIPSGKYIGKMWKRFQDKTWYLCWYGVHENPEFLSINLKEIKQVEPNFLYMYDENRTLITEPEVSDFKYYQALQKQQQKELIRLAIVEAEQATLPQVFLPYAMDKTGVSVYEHFNNDNSQLLIS